MAGQAFQWLAALIAVVTAAGAGAQEPETPRYWLERMVEAAGQLDYDGRFVYLHDGRLQAMRIVHGVDADGKRSRLVTLNGPFREVVRNDGTVTCYLPDGDSVIVGKTGPGRPFLITVPTHLDKLENHYRFEVGGNARVAGRSTRRLSIHPRDDYRYGHRFWLDRESGLLLRSELVDGADDVVEQVLFTAIEFRDELPAEALQPETRGEELVWYRQKDEKPLRSFTEWQVTALPPGFRKDIHRKHHLPAVDAPVEHMVFTDGLASISVFIERRGEGTADFEGMAAMGGVNAFSRNLDGHRVTVVGEAPAKAVREVADAVRHRGKGGGE